MLTKLEIVQPFIDKAIHLNPFKFNDYIKENPDTVIIDLRSNDDFRAGHIRNAVNIERGFIETSITERYPNPNTKFVFYCIGGGISAMAQLTVKEYGYKTVFDISGGIKNYVNKGFTIFNTLGEIKIENYGLKE